MKVNHHLFRPQPVVDSMFLIYEGQIEILSQQEHQSVAVTRLSQGMGIGLHEIVNSKSQRFQAVCVQQAQVLEIDARTVLKLHQLGFIQDNVLQ